MVLFDRYDTTIKSKGKRFLKEIISDEDYRKWFSSKKQGKIFVLNKGRCGNGGTTGFIDYAKRHNTGLTIIVPNVSIVKSKEWDENLCCLYGGAEGIDPLIPIRVCTWDKHKSVECFPQFGMDFENNFWATNLLVIDEYHKLIDDCNYREICAKVVKTIINTKLNVVLMSATPNYEFIDFLKEVSGKIVETINIDYGEDRDGIPPIQWVEKGKKKIFDIINMVMTKPEQAIFFYNSVKKVSEIVSQIEDTSAIEVLCSKSNENKGVPCYSEDFNPEKKFHFMTSAYFTGMDVNIHIPRVVIIGGNNEAVLSYSNKEIKQMLGRMREGYGGAFVIHDGRALNQKALADYVAKKERCEYIVSNIQGEARKDEKFLQEYLDKLYYNGMVEKMNGWNDFYSFKQMLSVYDEYRVKKIKIGEPEHFKKKRDISFEEYKKKRLNGENVSYRYKAICEKYIELCGLERFKEASRNEIERYVKLNDMVGDIDIGAMSGSDKYHLLLGDGYYYGRFLMGVLDYLGSKCGYEVLEENMNKVFGSFCIYDSGNTAKKNGCLFLSVLNKDIRKMSKIGDNSLIKKDTFLSPISDKKRINNVRISKKVSAVGQRTQCITDTLGTTEFKSLMDINAEFFKVILENTDMVPEIKHHAEWGEVFEESKKYQTMISEFYKDIPSTVKYPHKKDEMEKIDCVIVDIDDSITYKDFSALYGEHQYWAYPSISNSDPDNWNKFRVIFPLATTLSIPNDNLGVLKLIRRMVCKYEDKNHQLGSYINAEQWQMRRENEGCPIEISQDMIVYLDNLVKSLKTYSWSFKRSANGSFSINDPNYFWSLERAYRYYEEHDIDGERHTALFVIKNRLSEDDCDLFVDWLRLNHPDKMKHWFSHKRCVRMAD